MALKKSKMMMMSSKISSSVSIPQDIIDIHILPKLPVTSLLRFKSVAKHWDSLISSPDFAKVHLHQQHQKSPSSSCLFIQRMHLVDNYTTSGLFYTLTVERVSSVQSHGVAATMDPKLKLSRYYEYEPDPSIDDMHRWLIGSCDGLICVLLKRMRYTDARYGLNLFVLIWNPSTKQQRVIKVPFLSYQHTVVSSAFGYDPSIDDYKIVILAKYLGNWPIEIYVFLLKKNKWKKKHMTNLVLNSIDDVSCHNHVICNDRTVLGCETFYWLLGDHTIDGSMKLIAFDLTLESIDVIPLPDEIVELNVYNDVHLCNIKKDLGICLVKTTSRGSKLEVSMLERVNTLLEKPIWRRVGDIQEEDYGNSFEPQDDCTLSRQWIEQIVSSICKACRIQQGCIGATYTKQALVHGFSYTESLFSPINMTRVPRLRKAIRHYLNYKSYVKSHI